MGTDKTNWKFKIHRMAGATGDNDHVLNEHKGSINLDDDHSATPSEFSDLMKEAVGSSRSGAFNDAAADIRAGFGGMTTEDKDGLFELCRRLRIRATGGTP